MPTRTLRSLLTHTIDYAGLFPPASLGMRAAVEEYAGRLAGEEAWALGRFVLPAARLGEFEQEAGELLPRGTGGEPWRLGVLVAADGDPHPLVAFNERHGRPEAGRALIDTIEVKVGSADEVAAVAGAFRAMIAYHEIPIDPDPTTLVEAVRLVGGRAKVRTGGVTADAFPTAEQLVRFVRRCIDAGVPFKATAGLHHPLRGEYRLTYDDGAARGTMFGFLNVFLAAAFMLAGLDDDEARLLLEERDGAAFAFDDDGVRWRDHQLSAAGLDRARERLAISFGSCSFGEPIDDLAALRLL